MSAYSFRDSNIRKTWAIFVLFLVVVIGIGWVFAQVYNDSTILYIAVIFSIVINFVAYWRSDSIALSLSKARLAGKENFREIHNIVENLSITAGIPMPKIYIINDASANAFATGRNPKHASIALTTGIIERLDRSELEGVIAHELSHIKNYDILLSTIVVVLVGFLAILSDIFMRSLWFRGRGDNDRSNPVLLLVGIALALISPIVATLIQLAVSRKREFLADASGALLTRYPEGLASALEKIAVSSPLKNAKNATAHLFIANPFKADSQKKTPFLARLFMTHPPIEERVRVLREM